MGKALGILLLGLVAVGLAGFGLAASIVVVVNEFYWFSIIMAVVHFLVVAPLFVVGVRRMIKGETPRVQNKFMWGCLGLAVVGMAMAAGAPFVWDAYFWVCRTRLHDPMFEGWCWCGLGVLFAGLTLFVLWAGLLLGVVTTRLVMFRWQRRDWPFSMPPGRKRKALLLVVCGMAFLVVWVFIIIFQAPGGAIIAIPLSFTAIILIIIWQFA